MAESTLGVINRGYVYKIPPAKTISGHRAGDWDLEKPLAGPLRVRIVERGAQCIIKLEEPTSNQLFAECPYSDTNVMNVLDSSRYFVLTLLDGSGRRAMIGLGFQEKSESFDFNAAIDTFKRYQRQEEQAKKAAEAWASQPHESMALAEGATIHINIKSSKPKKKEESGSFTGILAPPPGAGASAGRIAPPPQPAANAAPVAVNPASTDFFGNWGSASASPAPAHPPAAVAPAAANKSLDDLFGSFASAPQQQQQAAGNPFDDSWGDFTSSAAAPPATAPANGNWTMFF